MGDHQDRNGGQGPGDYLTVMTTTGTGRATRADVTIEAIQVSAYTVSTDLPEADGTLEWDQTTLVLVEASGGGKRSLGYTYADTATALLIHDTLVPIVIGLDAMDIPGAWSAMIRATRNLGRPGIVSMAISAVDSALWDLKARILNLPLVSLLGAMRESIPVYGSGGFTSYSAQQLHEQLAGWVAQGISRVKMKVGAHPEDDLNRVRTAREAIGSQTELFVDANGAYSRKQALLFSEEFKREYNVIWFEEPVPSDDLQGLHLLCTRAPAGLDITAGEYGYQPTYFRRMLEAGAVDVLQADASRCEGVTGFLKVGALCEARLMPLSTHCAPSLHAHLGCAVSNVRHLEYFHDHVRIEHTFFDGVLDPIEGALHPDLSRPGFGLEFKRTDAAQYAV
jgi:L-alanine-DL-glutamate epimerase-like enolase superfamily enzyme